MRYFTYVSEISNQQQEFNINSDPKVKEENINTVRQANPTDSWLINQAKKTRLQE